MIDAPFCNAVSLLTASNPATDQNICVQCIKNSCQ